jgi:hypothetical protein
MTEPTEKNMRLSHSAAEGEDATAAEIISSPEFKLLYSNNVTLSGSAWDFHLTFGELFADITGKSILEKRVMIALSPQTAKALISILSTAVINYEAQLGPIGLGPIQPTEEPSA